MLCFVLRIDVIDQHGVEIRFVIDRQKHIY